MDGQPLDIGHARQRCVLASLLVDVNRPVSVDQLIDRVWSAEPPHRARNALAGYLSRLRALLTDAGDLQITRGPAGYTLTTEALSVDLHLFRHLAAEARSTADPHEATALFGRALALWRGEPFAAIDTPWISDCRTSLEAERLSVVLDRNDVALRAGQHTELTRRAHRCTPRPSARRTTGRTVDARAIPLRASGRRIGHLPQDAGSPHRRARHRPQPAAARNPPADPRKRCCCSAFHAVARRRRPSPVASPLRRTCRVARSASSAVTARWLL